MKRLLLLVAAGFALAANAIEYRTVESATVLYDAPSQRGGKFFVIKRETPVEVVVSLEGWSKVRDAEGGLAWIEKKYLSDKRSVIVTADRAEVRQKAEDGSSLVFEAEKNVALDYLETAPGGWIKVRHRDGQSGFIRANQIWGL
ncbi:SH3 domain-containing protein [Propionivibrio sp.]|uniref:SH3 domain-containing protein n=1 Tax=Propionivibrio sp. TaxID=2212460 RepID=UPI002604489A|nr:SH3 domain-containing protein [Propionivibrio sp.]